MILHSGTIQSQVQWTVTYHMSRVPERRRRHPWGRIRCNKSHYILLSEGFTGHGRWRAGEYFFQFEQMCYSILAWPISGNNASGMRVGKEIWYLGWWLLNAFFGLSHWVVKFNPPLGLLDSMETHLTTSRSISLGKLSREEPIFKNLICRCYRKTS